MDLSNREAAAYWYKLAAEEPDADLRKQALATHRKYLKMAQREEHMRLWLQNPGHGVRSMFVLVVFVALIVLVVILLLSKSFPIVLVSTVFTLVFGLFIVAAAFAMRVYGHITPETMLEMFKLGLKVLPASGASKPFIEAITAVGGRGASPPQRRLSSDAPVIPSESDQK